MKIPPPWHHILLALGAINVLTAGAFAADGQTVTVTGDIDPLGFRKAIPVNISGFTGDAA